MGLKINVDINNLSTDCNKMTDLISELKYAMQTALTTYGNDNEEAVNIFLAADK